MKNQQSLMAEEFLRSVRFTDGTGNEVFILFADQSLYVHKRFRYETGCRAMYKNVCDFLVLYTELINKYLYVPLNKLNKFAAPILALAKTAGYPECLLFYWCGLSESENNLKDLAETDATF